jgi:hypothetical protein
MESSNFDLRSAIATGFRLDSRNVLEAQGQGNPVPSPDFTSDTSDALMVLLVFTSDLKFVHKCLVSAYRGLFGPGKRAYAVPIASR